jgi:hypothetical protein
MKKGDGTRRDKQILYLILDSPNSCFLKNGHYVVICTVLDLSGETHRANERGGEQYDKQSNLL